MPNLERLLENIPSWVKWLLLVGGALMSAFASRFPESIQSLGLLAGIAFAGCGCIGVVWHFTNEWRKRRGKPSLKVEPSYIIILGLMLALAGTVWLLARGSSAGLAAANVQSNENVGTHLRIKFGSGATLPFGSDLANIWRWYTLANVVVLNSKDGSAPPTEIKTWNIFLTFEHPIDVKQIVLDADRSLPRYEIKDVNNRSAVIALMGDVVDTSIDIRVLTGSDDTKRLQTNPGASTVSSNTAVSLPTPPNRPQPQAKNYFGPEKIELGNLLSKISDQLNGDALTAAQQGFQYGNLSLPATSHELEALLHQTEGTSKLLQSVWNQVWIETVDKNPKFRTDLESVVGQKEGQSPYGRTPINQFMISLELFRRDLAVLVERIDSIPERDRAWIILSGAKRTSVDVQSKADAFRGWVQQCNGRIDNMREVLR